MDDVIIRSAGPGDVRALTDLARRTFCETFVDGFALGYPQADLESFLDASYSERAVARWIVDRRGFLQVAESDDRLLAYAQAGDNGLPVADPEPGDGELKRLYVTREAQGQGLGPRLLDAALQWLSGRRVFIGVWSGNAKALALYQTRGFAAVGAYRFKVGASEDDEVILGRGPWPEGG